MPIALQVSIPFKRESVSKVVISTPMQVKINSFNSLQTGKCIQSEADEKALSAGILFQFPSNGKVYPKEYSEEHLSEIASCFNSLQTGKCIQRSCAVTKTDPVVRFQFPSNGKVYPK